MGWTENDFLLSFGGYQASDKRNVLENEGYFMLAYTFRDKVVIVTGGANGIGRCIADEFRSQGAVVYVIDKQEGEHFVGDISPKEVLEAFVSTAA